MKSSCFIFINTPSPIYSVYFFIVVYVWTCFHVYYEKKPHFFFNSLSGFVPTQLQAFFHYSFLNLEDNTDNILGYYGVLQWANTMNNGVSLYHLSSHQTILCLVTCSISVVCTRFHLFNDLSGEDLILLCCLPK